MSVLVIRLLAVHDALSAAKLPHAFGGAIALAYCTKEPRGTRDLDVNIFTDAASAGTALAALPSEVTVRKADVKAVVRDGQRRFWWDDTPIDVFLNNLPYHREVAKGARWVPLAGREIPVLDAAALVVFKAFFNRTKDWADIESIAAADVAGAREGLSQLETLVGPEDPAAIRLAELLA